MKTQTPILPIQQKKSRDKIVADELTKTLSSSDVVFNLDEPRVKFGETSFESYTIMQAFERATEHFYPIVEDIPNPELPGLPPGFYQLSDEQKRQMRRNLFSVAAMRGILANDDLIYLIETDDRNEGEANIEKCIARAANTYANETIATIDDLDGFRN